MFGQGNNVAPDNTAVGANVAIGSRGIVGFPLKPLHILTAANLLNGDPSIRLAFGNGTTNPTNESFFGHLALLTSNTLAQRGLDYPRCNGWGLGGYTATEKDLVLINNKYSEDLILTTFNKLGNIRFSTTQTDVLDEWGALTDYERMTITPSGKIGVGTRLPLGRFDINVGNWDFNLPKISFTINPDVNYTNNPQMRLYRSTGYYASMPDDRYESFSWFIEGGQTTGGEYGTLEFRAGYTPKLAGGEEYRNIIGVETPTTRMTLLSNGNVGINETQPTTKLQVKDGTVLFNGNTGDTPTDWSGNQLGAGTRFMWVPGRAALRAGVLENLATFGSFWDDNNIGDYSQAFGLNCAAFNSYSVAFGKHSTAGVAGNPYGEGFHGSMALGHNCRSEGIDALALGFSDTVTSEYSICMGSSNRTNESFSWVIGDNIETATKYTLALGLNLETNGGATVQGAFLIGKGIDKYQRLENNTPNSLAVGFNSNVPTLYVDGASGSANSLGSVGVCTVSPSGSLSVHTGNGGVTIGSNTVPPSSNPMTPQLTSADCDLSVEHNVGIGTLSPTEKLSVIDGTVIVSDNASDAVSATDVSIVAMEKVLIGTTTYLNGTRNPSGQAMLQVNGDAIKFQPDATWDIASDSRYKKNITGFNDGLSKLREIRPIWFEYNGRFGIESQKPGVGIIAQEMQKVFPYMIKEDTLKRTVVVKPEKRYLVDIVDSITIKVPIKDSIDEHGHHPDKDSLITRPTKKWVIEKPEYKEELESILVYNPGPLFYVLVNSVKELDSTLTYVKKETSEEKIGLQSTIDSMRIVMQTMQDKIARLEQKDTIKIEGIEDVLLEQNNPNPFSTSANITYYIPSSIQGNCEMIVTPTNQSSVLKRIELSKGSPNQVTINAEGLNTGVYCYTIISSNKILASKKMIIIH